MRLSDAELAALQAENARLTSEVSRLREALRSYGWHRASCYERQPIPLGSEAYCDCGLAAALAPQEGLR